LLEIETQFLLGPRTYVQHFTSSPASAIVPYEVDYPFQTPDKEIVQ
jgi:hypothetical protein